MNSSGEISLKASSTSACKDFNCSGVGLGTLSRNISSALPWIWRFVASMVILMVSRTFSKTNSFNTCSRSGELGFEELALALSEDDLDCAAGAFFPADGSWARSGKLKRTHKDKQYFFMDIFLRNKNTAVLRSLSGQPFKQR